ncbi:SDR family oxidoreductase [Lentzea sp. NBRC 102530]|uniref:SDR family NAD(P)-dependent oxidoreductase n=1 Tax=Lentzea sp. NBRC 102530 TaxID=3032201 RepID=UPI0024A58071|nr:SDR family oxidoreductase [Lentzea sp. NBRC 102530]GLY50838.1 hypothetical protein Lesp01_44940 [Lentzea sp. NBRC 102530]
MNRLHGKVAVVGGALGILGLPAVRAMAAEGARVVMLDLSPEVHAHAEQLVADGHDVVPYVGDVSVEPDVAAAVELARTNYGRLDILWNNVALNSAEWLQQDTDAVGVSLEHLMRTMRVNVGGVLLGSKHAVPLMAATGGGSIINTSSLAAAGGDLVTLSYGASKAAIEHVTRSVATAFGHLGIRSNAIAPGLIQAAATGEAHVLEGVAPTRLVMDSQMLRVAGEPGDIANAVVYLGSDESKFVTGQVLHVDGGFTGHLPTLADRRRQDAARIPSRG